MNFVWKIKRLFLPSDIRKLVDRYKDNEEYLRPDITDRVKASTVKDAEKKGLVKTRKTSDNHRVIKLTKKGLLLSKAKTIIRWDKVSAIVAMLAVLTPIGLYIYDKHDATSQKTLIYDYAYVSDDNLDIKQNSENVDCWVNGIGGRSDVYKCTKDSLIYVPCFRQDVSEKVKCPHNPKTDTGAKYFNAKFAEDTKPLMTTYGKDPSPWYIYLTTGEECMFLHGATTTIANKRMDFGCEDSEITLYLPTSERDGVYTIGCLKRDKLEQCQIKEMWR